MNTETLRDGELVRYRTSTRDNSEGTAPDWGPWNTGSLLLVRRTQPLPKRMKRPGVKSHEVGAIITLAIRDTYGAEYSEDDYSPEYDEWLVENFRLQFEPTKSRPAA